MDFELYRGKAEQQSEGVSATAYPAYVLLRDEKHYKWYFRQLIHEL